MKEVEHAKKSKKKEGEGDAKKEEKKNDERKKKDGDGKDKSKEKKKCKSCGKDYADEGDKKGGQDQAKKGGGDSEKKSDESKDKNDHGGGSGGWTDEQDAKLKEMKEANKSWKEIVAEIGHHQGECKKRLKELAKAGEDKSGGDRATEGGSGDNNAAGSGWGNSWDNGGQVDGGDLSFGDLFMDAPAKESEKQDNNNGNGDNNQKGSKGGHDGGGKHHQAGDEGWSYKSNQPSQPSHRPQGKLQANDVWSKDDCEVLEILEAQYREHKWLQIQAGFFNWTGRMISAELIENKFKEDGAL